MKNVLEVFWVNSHIPRKNQPLKDTSGNAAKNLLVRTSRWPWPPVYFSVPSQMGLQMCLNIQSCSTFKNLRNKPADVSVLGCVLALAACGRDILWFQLCYNHLQNEGFFRIRKGLLMWISNRHLPLHGTGPFEPSATLLTSFFVPSADVSFVGLTLLPLLKWITCPAGPSLESRIFHGVPIIPPTSCSCTLFSCITAISLLFLCLLFIMSLFLFFFLSLQKARFVRILFLFDLGPLFRRA